MTKRERQADEYADEATMADEERAAHIADFLRVCGWHRAAVCVVAWQRAAPTDAERAAIAEAAKFLADEFGGMTTKLPIHSAIATIRRYIERTKA